MSAYQKLESIYNRIDGLHHLQSIAGWDEAVMMPAGGGKSRAHALATLSALIHETKTQKKVGELIEQAKEEHLTDPWQSANLKWIEKQYLSSTCLDSHLVEATTKASITSEQAWRELREENNWAAFAPLLKKTLSLVKEAAKIKSEVFNLSPYDVLIDEYSPGMSQAIINPIFFSLKNTVPELIQNIIEHQQQTALIPINGVFAPEKQRELGLHLMQAIGFDFNHGRLDVSHHPFCGGVPRDVRITTRYRTDEFISSAMAVCHETGHARYEQGLPEQWLSQPVGTALGMSVHESQSLLIEMQACRTPEFMQFLSPLIKRYFGDEEAYTPHNLFNTYTRVSPSLIRVDADEVTYPMHVILRYEIEQALIADDVTVEDLPELWDAKMQEYFGLSTKGNFKDGVMQDVHWPSGAFGYFPAYTLGSLIAAQLFSSAKQAHPNIPQEISTGEFATLFEWLNKNVHSRASSVSTKQLLIDATGETLNPDYFIRHVKQRYLG